MEQDYNTGTTDVPTEVAGAATDVSVQRDLQANDDDASMADFEGGDPEGTAAVLKGNFPGPTYDITPSDDNAESAVDNQEATE